MKFLFLAFVLSSHLLMADQDISDVRLQIQIQIGICEEMKSFNDNNSYLNGALDAYIYCLELLD